MNYVNYGTSGHEVTPEGLVIENYLRRAGHGTALDLPAGLRAPGLDPADLRNYHPLNARLRMNHYWTKSKAECQAKFERGRSDQAGARKWPDDFLHRERAINEVHGTEILRWLEPLRVAMGLLSSDELAA